MVNLTATGTMYTGVRAKMAYMPDRPRRRRLRPRGDQCGYRPPRDSITSTRRDMQVEGLAQVVVLAKQWQMTLRWLLLLLLLRLDHRRRPCCGRRLQ